MQAFELDDWHAGAPLHSAALLLPALLAAAEHIKAVHGRAISGESFLLAFIVGLELGPRIGLGLGGADMLSRGWHSGAVFGGPTVAIAASRLLKLSPQQTGWAIGTACTQAGGLMAAQFGSMTKRMQHGFAARNGLLAALLARADYTGIEGVLERPYGGFFSTFSRDLPSKPDARFQSAVADLGKEWQTRNVLVKPYPLMAFLHAPVDCVKLLQEKYKDRLSILGAIKEIKIELGEHSYKHGGWKPDVQPLEVTGAQMSAAYAVALQLVDQDVSPMSFASTKLNRESLFEVINKIECLHRKDFDGGLKTHITINFDDVTGIEETVEGPLGVLEPLGHEEILRKWEVGVGAMIDGARKQAIQSSILKIEELADLDDLLIELRKHVESIID